LGGVTSWHKTEDLPLLPLHKWLDDYAMVAWVWEVIGLPVKKMRAWICTLIFFALCGLMLPTKGVIFIWEVCFTKRI
jgi:hypothetical protein